MTRHAHPWLMCAPLFALLLVCLLLVSCASFYRTTAASDPDAYWRQRAEQKLTPDSEAHWNHALATVDLISYTQNPIFPPPSESYALHMYRDWIRKNGKDRDTLNAVYGFFAADTDYGWPAEIKGIPWVYAINAWVWSAPSVAMIEPGRTAEAAFLVREMIKVIRSPSAWQDYAIEQGWEDPMRANVMWKYPLLMAEGLYGLMTGDLERYRPEMEAVARDLYATMLENQKKKRGKGYSGGVCCEPNHWFPQCNSGGALALAMYDRLYGKDEKYGVMIGGEYRRVFLKFLRKEMCDPKSSRLYRRYHPEGPLQADKAYSAFAQIVVAVHMKMFEPDFARQLYDLVIHHYVKTDPLLGTFLLEVPEYDDFKRGLNRGAQAPGMLGEPAVGILILLQAAREFEDHETSSKLLKTLTALGRPYYRQGELRFDETNPDPIGIGDRTTGQLLNMFSGWFLLGKVHQGWEAILNHDWSQHRDANGFLLNNP